jgi:hypothetical protein
MVKSVPEGLTHWSQGIYFIQITSIEFPGQLLQRPSIMADNIFYLIYYPERKDINHFQNQFSAINLKWNPLT